MAWRYTPVPAILWKVCTRRLPAGPWFYQAGPDPKEGPFAGPPGSLGIEGRPAATACLQPYAAGFW